jgi:outer membrane protein assembly factor BamB
MTRTRLWLLSCGLLLTAMTFARAGDWTNWRGPFQNGYSPETNLPAKWTPAGDNLVWKAPIGSRSTPLIMKGRVFVINYTAAHDKAGNDIAATIQERIMCMDANTGKTIWEHAFPVFHTDIVTVRLGWTNLVADPETGYVYGHGTQGLLMCLDGMADKATVVWQRSLSEEYGRITGYGGRVTSPVLFEDIVAIGMFHSSWGDYTKLANRFVAFDKKTGEVRWWSDPAGQVKDTYFSVPVTAKINGVDLIISGAADGSVVAMKARTGELVWRYPFASSAVNCAPVVSGSLVYIAHGEENNDNNIQGRIICLDASQLEKVVPKLIWKVDGITVRYTSPIIHDDKLYVTDEIGKLYCLDATTGKQHWKFNYGRNSRGSPVLADGKIYVADVNSKFQIIDATAAKPKLLNSTFFPAVAGAANVEVNGSPAIANGRVYFATSDEFYCFGAKAPAAAPALPKPPVVKGAAVGPVAHLQIAPADVVVHPGESAKFQIRGFDANGNFVKMVDGATWSLPAPPLPAGAKAAPPPLDGTIKDGALTVDAKKTGQQGYVEAKLGDLVGKARVRVAPTLPYVQDFSKIPDGAAPGGWVNTQGKFVVATVGGEKLLRKVNDKSSPLIAIGNGYIGLPTLKDYTIECDLQATALGGAMPDMGIVANRYTLVLAGNHQKLRLYSWEPLPRVDTTIPFNFKAGVWYRMKLTTQIAGNKGHIQGKVWPRDAKEPAAWTVQLDDPRPVAEGSPALFGNVTGFVGGAPGNEIFYDNLRITPNGKAPAGDNGK